MERVLACGCDYLDEFDLEFCPTHEAAETMRDAIAAYVVEISIDFIHGRVDRDIWEKVKPLHKTIIGLGPEEYFDDLAIVMAEEE